jgi:predicted site-specific integrase-resolvase
LEQKMTVRKIIIACYCRVSSDSQKHESQKEEIRSWLKGIRIKLSEVTWYEDTESGAAAARPGLEAMKKAIFGGEVDTIVFWKLDASPATCVRESTCWPSGANGSARSFRDRTA